MKKTTILTACILFSIIGISYADVTFVANIDGNWDLYYADDEGANPVQITNTPYDEKDPSWSSDRKKLVYTTSDGHLNIIDTATGKSHQVALEYQNTPQMTPAFSPGDKTIAFIQSRPDAGDDTDLFVFDMKTASIRKVLDQKGIQMGPAWSPDGSRIAYANSHCLMDCGRFIQELWVTDPNGGWARQLSLTHSFCQQPDWSPDGKKIVFASDMNGNFDIWVLSLNDWKMTQITMDVNLDISPAWSPDGKKLSFVSTRSGIMEIWIKDLVGGGLRMLRPFGDRDIECKDVDW